MNYSSHNFSYLVRLCILFSLHYSDLVLCFVIRNFFQFHSGSINNSADIFSRVNWKKCVHTDFLMTLLSVKLFVQDFKTLIALYSKLYTIQYLCYNVY